MPFQITDLGCCARPWRRTVLGPGRHASLVLTHGPPSAGRRMSAGLYTGERCGPTSYVCDGHRPANLSLSWLIGERPLAAQQRALAGLRRVEDRRWRSL